MRQLFLILVCMGQIWAQSHPTLYVASPNGLSLREGPDKESKRIHLMSYGTRISNYSFSDGEWITIDGYGGRWIHLMNEGKTGYAFDGYTLPFQVPEANTNTLKYMVAAFGKIVFEDSVKTGMDAGDDYMNKHIYHFSNGVIYIDTEMYEAYESTLLNLELDFRKGYLLYYLMEEMMWGKHHLVRNISYPIKEFKSDTLDIKLNQNGWQSLDISYVEGAISYFRIMWLAGGLTITWGSAV